MSQPFPSAQAATECLEGVPGGCVRSLGWTLKRTALLATGMYLAGERRDLWKKVRAGSLAVQAIVMVDTALRPPEKRGQVLSSLAALDGSPLAILATWVGRSAIVWAGLQMAGQKRHAWRNAFAGTAAIEVAVLMWAKENRA